ncbi:MAG: hypothetical protein KGR26_13615, partial [Cyanobacteria bacterium REEB65]|nr:hypothetical protein [Cyanobacteria bacterium REEB65]
VTFPANGQARVGAVKSLSDLDSEDWSEIDAALRTEGLSQRDAKRAVSGFKKYLRRDAGGPNTSPRDEVVAAELADMVRRNIATLNTR